MFSSIILNVNVATKAIIIRAINIKVTCLCMCFNPFFLTISISFFESLLNNFFNEKCFLFLFSLFNDFSFSSMNSFSKYLSDSFNLA